MFDIKIRKPAASLSLTIRNMGADPSGRAVYKAWVCGRLSAEIVGSNSSGGMDVVSCECCVMSDRGLCDELITLPEESYRPWCVVCGI